MFLAKNKSKNHNKDGITYVIITKRQQANYANDKYKARECYIYSYVVTAILHPDADIVHSCLIAEQP